MRAAFCQVAPAVLGDQRPHLRSILFEFGRVGNDVFDNQVPLGC
jgi:hypothetical protein